MKASTAWRAAVWWLPAAVVAVHLPWMLARRAAGHLGDFDLAREFGRRFLNGESLYQGGLHYPYAPAAALFFAPLSLLPTEIAFVARYAIALGALALTLRWLERMNGSADGQEPKLALLTIVLASHYVLRDLDDAGPHLILLAIAVASLRFAASGRETAAAIALGFAAAVKPPFALFLPYVLWKGRLRLTGLAAIALAAWLAVPAVRTGLPGWWSEQRQWASVALRSAIGDPIPGADESERRVQNQSLSRVVDRLTPGTPVPWGTVIAAALGIAVAVRLQGPLGPGQRREWTREWAAILLLSALLSPVTWVQHFVVVIPALHWILSLERPARGALALYSLLALGLNRELLGRESYLMLLAGGLHTACALLLLGVLLRRRETAADELT